MERKILILLIFSVVISRCMVSSSPCLWNLFDFDYSSEESDEKNTTDKPMSKPTNKPTSKPEQPTITVVLTAPINLTDLAQLLNGKASNIILVPSPTAPSVINAPNENNIAAPVLINPAHATPVAPAPAPAPAAAPEPAPAAAPAAAPEAAPAADAAAPAADAAAAPAVG